MKSELKSSLANIISAVDEFFEQWDPSTGTQMEEVCGLQKGTMMKNKPHLVGWLVSLLNGISTFVRYLMPKLSL